jgi:pyruvate kinase
MTFEIKIDLMIVFSDDIEVAKAVSKFHSNCLVFYPTFSELQVKYLRFMRGIYPLHLAQNLSVEEIIKSLIFMQQENIKGIEKVLILNVYLLRMKKNGFYIKNVI